MRYLFLFLYLLLILAVLFAERKSPTEALLWVVVLICLPYAGIILYLIFGSTLSIKLTASLRKKRLEQYHPSEESEYLPPAPVPLQISEEDRQVICFNEAYHGSRLTCYDDIQFYTDGESHYRQLFADIAAAEDCIYVEFYTIHHDRVGKAFVDALTRKAKEGVRVLVMCDFIANVSTPPKMFRPLKEAGGKIIRVKPYLTHYRSHRKIVVIDHRLSYIGGMNIGAKYANLAPKKNPWRDTQVRLTGACTAVLEQYFLNDWLCSVKRREWDQNVGYMDLIPQQEQECGQNFCQFIVGGVDNHKESMKMCYLSMIRAARQKIRIQTPYFIPDASILDALKTAAAAGIQIELMIPGVAAGFFLDPVTNYYCGQLLEYGVSVYRYQGYIHAKTMVVDDELCCIGSVNMDMRSLMVDDEICGVFYENRMVAEYSALYDRDIAHCTPYTYEQFLKRGWAEKCRESVFLLFAPLM